MAFLGVRCTFVQPIENNNIDPLDEKERLLLIEGHINHIGSNDAVQTIELATDRYIVLKRLPLLLEEDRELIDDRI
jgi:acyl-coenzyme A thioesterase PaaI-like protein